MTVAILEPCPHARRVKSIIKRRDAYNYKCKLLCPYCRGTATVMTCPDCDGCGLKKGGVICERCHTRGKVPGKHESDV